MTSPESLASHPTPLLQDRINFLNTELRRFKKSDREHEHYSLELREARKIMKARKS